MRSLESICYADDLDCTVLAHVSKKFEVSSTMKCLELLQLDKFRIAYTQRVFLTPNMAAKLRPASIVHFVN